MYKQIKFIAVCLLFIPVFFLSKSANASSACTGQAMAAGGCASGSCSGGVCVKSETSPWCMAWSSCSTTYPGYSGKCVRPGWCDTGDCRQASETCVSEPGTCGGYTSDGCTGSSIPPPPSCTSYRSVGRSCGGSGQCC